VMKRRDKKGEEEESGGEGGKGKRVSNKDSRRLFWGLLVGDDRSIKSSRAFFGVRQEVRITD
jgi:hypothetical protein